MNQISTFLYCVDDFDGTAFVENTDIFFEDLKRIDFNKIEIEPHSRVLDRVLLSVYQL